MTNNNCKLDNTRDAANAAQAATFSRSVFIARNTIGGATFAGHGDAFRHGLNITIIMVMITIIIIIQLLSAQ